MAVALRSRRPLLSVTVGNRGASETAANMECNPESDSLLESPSPGQLAQPPVSRKLQHQSLALPVPACRVCTAAVACSRGPGANRLDLAAVAMGLAAVGCGMHNSRRQRAGGFLGGISLAGGLDANAAHHQADGSRTR